MCALLREQSPTPWSSATSLASDHDEARALVRGLLDGLPSGSYLSLNEGSRGTDPAYEAAQDAYNETGAVPYFLRPVDQIEAYFEGLDLVEPGVVSVPLWHPEPGSDPQPIGQHGGVGRKPWDAQSAQAATDV